MDTGLTSSSASKREFRTCNVREPRLEPDGIPVSRMETGGLLELSGDI